MTRAPRTALTIATLVAAVAATDASAAQLLRQTYQNAGSACTGALPTYEGALRKRPRAIANEGATSAFVTCSTDTEETTASRPHFAFIRVFNAGPSTVTVSCTFVNGADWEGSVNDTKTVTLNSGGSTMVTWGENTVDAPSFSRWTVNFSCALPPGAGLSYVGRRYRQDIGAL